MAPQKRRRVPSREPEVPGEVKRLTKLDRERLICKKKLDALDVEESQITEDRFSPVERKRLLDAYNENGFQVFQDTKLLHQYFPTRRESDLRGLIQRLRTSLLPNQSQEESGHSQQSQSINEWTKLCQGLMGAFARDRRINLDDVLADALKAEADERELGAATTSDSNLANTLEPNYPELLRSFSQLLVGKFPDNMSPANAQISMKLFDHINSMVDSIDLEKTFSPLMDGRWLSSTIGERHRRQEMALKGLKLIDGTVKKCPTLRDVERDRNIEALCLELPKIKRITDVLNPLRINESLVSALMEHFNAPST